MFNIVFFLLQRDTLKKMKLKAKKTGKVIPFMVIDCSTALKNLANTGNLHTYSGRLPLSSKGISK